MRKFFALSSVALVALTLTVSGCAKKEEAPATTTETPTTTTTTTTTTTPAAPESGMAAPKDTTSHM